MEDAATYRYRIGWLMLTLSVCMALWLWHTDMWVFGAVASYTGLAVALSLQLAVLGVRRNPGDGLFVIGRESLLAVGLAFVGLWHASIQVAAASWQHHTALAPTYTPTSALMVVGVVVVGGIGLWRVYTCGEQETPNPPM